MPKDYTTTYILPGLWRQISEIRHSVGELLREYGPQVENGGKVAVSELIENAIKYGVSVPNMTDVLLEVSIANDLLTITVQNGIDGLESVQRLQANIARLEQATDPKDVFLARLEELSTRLDDTAGLGIFRVAAEGEFQVSAQIKGDIVVVVAVRPLKEKG